MNNLTKQHIEYLKYLKENTDTLNEKINSVKRGSLEFNVLEKEAIEKELYSFYTFTKRNKIKNLLN